MQLVFFYFAGVFLWPFLWFGLGGLSLLKSNKFLSLPFFLCLIILGLNIVMGLHHGEPSTVEVEENLFRFLDSRTTNINSVISGILVISAVIYSVADRKFPHFFLRYVGATYISLIGFMTPIIWIPTDKLDWLRGLRAFQTVPFTFGIFLAITAVLILLTDVMKWLGRDQVLKPKNNSNDKN